MALAGALGRRSGVAGARSCDSGLSPAGCSLRGRHVPSTTQRSRSRSHVRATQSLSSVSEEHAAPARPHERAPHFQLPLAVALAGSAFAAYLEPTGAEGLQEHGLNGTDVTFTDRAFLAEMCQGILFVELLHASGLRAADFTGASDPYAVLSVGPSMARSRVVFQSLNPAWHQRFFLYVKDLQADTLKVRLYDKDLFSSDDDLGTCLLPLSSLVPDQVTEMSLPLKGPGGQGSVYLRLRLARFSDHLLTRLTSHGASIPIDGGPGPAALQALEQGMAAMAALGQFRDQVVKKVDELRGAASANDVALSPWQVLALKLALYPQ